MLRAHQALIFPMVMWLLLLETMIPSAIEWSLKYRRSNTYVTPLYIVPIVPKLVKVIPKSSGYLLRGSLVSCLSTCLGGLEVKAVFDFPFSPSHRNNRVNNPSAVTD